MVFRAVEKSEKQSVNWKEKLPAVSMDDCLVEQWELQLVEVTECKLAVHSVGKLVDCLGIELDGLLAGTKDDK
jgi:hypothetical protein